MMSLQDISDYINQHNYDIRISRNSRFMDQKCTPDVVCVISDCVLEYTKNDNGVVFTKSEIWHSQYSTQLVGEYFIKPDAERDDVRREYDKFFSQPLLMLAASGVLKDISDNSLHKYVVERRDILEYISQSERNSTRFIDAFLTKVMTDSGMMGLLDVFFERQDKDSLEILRNSFASFYHNNTDIKKDYELPRIYNKIINILAFSRKKKGTVGGRLSKDIVSKSDIKYDRPNWRDFNKQRTISRQEAAQQATTVDEDSLQYFINKAKEQVRKLHPYSEIHRFKEYPATQAHHIFLASEYPEIADCIENIISLTPNQHFQKAHPNNKTSVADMDYRIVCLLCKLDSIEMNYREGHNDYSLSDFVNVLNIGLDTSDFNDRMSFEDIKFEIMKHGYYQRYLNIVK